MCIVRPRALSDTGCPVVVTDSSLAGAEKVARNRFTCLFVFGVDIVFSIVFDTAADGFEARETGSGCSVRVDIDYVCALDLLEKSHGGVSCVILHHVSIALTLASIVSGMLENASLTIRAL